MTIPIMPTIGQQIGPDLQNLGNALMDVIHPERKYELALKNAIAQDPSLLGKLATVAKDNPGALDRIFGPNAGAYLGGLNETPQGQFERSRAGAANTAMGDPNVSRDVGLLATTGQTATQRHSAETQAALGDLDLEHKQTIKAAIDSLKTSNPEIYNQLSQIGALNEYFGTDPNKQAIQQNEAEKAGVEGEARARVNIIADRAQTPDGIKDLWNKFKNGELSSADLGNAFDDPRTQGLKTYFDFQMKKDYEDFLLRKQSALLAGQDASRESREEAKLKVQAEKQIAYNNIAINKFLQRTTATKKGEKPMNEEQIQASLPQINELLARNQVLKGLEPESAPQFVMMKTGGIMGMFQTPKVFLMNPDGTPNTDPDFKVKNPVKTEGRPQGEGIDFSKSGSSSSSSSSGSTPAPTRKINIDVTKYKTRQDLIDSAEFKALPTSDKELAIKTFKPEAKQPKKTAEYETADDSVKKLVDAIIDKKLTADQVKSSPTFKGLTEKQKMKLLKSVEF